MDRYGTPEPTPLVRDAYDAPALAFFRWFAAYPVLNRIDTTGGITCVWFEDLRFITPGRDTPFR